MRFKLRMGVSGRHCPLKREDMDILFGKGSELHPIKPIVQPGQFTCEEKIILVTDKGEMPLRVIGPLRPYTQIELAKTDARQLGLNPPICFSGYLDGSLGGKIVGPEGEVILKEGIMLVQRHIHLCPETAAKYHLKNHDIVAMETTGSRALRFEHVYVRTGPDHADEIHIDTDEGNACGLENGALVDIVTRL